LFEEKIPEGVKGRRSEKENNGEERHSGSKFTTLLPCGLGWAE
jgi:hypothetical protein